MAVDTLIIEEKKPVAKSTVAVRKTVAVWYSEQDLELILALDPHLQLLGLRMGFVLYYFGYPAKDLKAPTDLSEQDKKSSWAVEKYQKEQAQYEEQMAERKDSKASAVAALERHCMLFVPCVSNACMLQLGRDIERDEKLASLFAQPAFQVMPVLFRLTHTGEANLGEPLAQAEGYQREVACRDIAARVEDLLRTSSYFQPMQKPAPLTTLLLPEPAPQIVAPTAPKKRRWSLFR
jgi:hypothetical protein